MDRRSRLLVEYIHCLRQAFRLTRVKLPFTIDAISILPDHLHTQWTLPENDADYPARWRLIKSQFTRGVKQSGLILPVDSRGEHKLWQRRYWEHTIRDDVDRQRHVDYIHYNSVKHGLVSRPTDWPYSSIHRYIRLGLLSHDWGGVTDQNYTGDFGESSPDSATLHPGYICTE